MTDATDAGAGCRLAHCPLFDPPTRLLDPNGAGSLPVPDRFPAMRLPVIWMFAPMLSCTPRLRIRLNPQPVTGPAKPSWITPPLLRMVTESAAPMWQTTEP